MKKLLASLVLVSVLVSVAFAEPPSSVTVQTNSTTVIPARSVTLLSAVAYASNTVYAQGAYVKVSDGQKYMALTAGKSSPTNGVGAPPRHRSGAASDWTNGLSWYAVTPVQRHGWVVYNAGACTSWVSIGRSPAELTKGSALAPGATLRSTGMNEYEAQLECSFIGATTHVLTFQEW
jgi:hypothetical protein